MKKEKRIAEIGDQVRALFDCELGDFYKGDTGLVVRHGYCEGTVFVYMDKWENEEMLDNGLACMVYRDHIGKYEYEVISKGQV